MRFLGFIFAIMALGLATDAVASFPERSRLARESGRRLKVQEWKTTPDGRKKWVDHVEIYDAEGRLVEEAEYSDFGTRLAWRSELVYDELGRLAAEYVYNERNKLSKVRKFEYDDKGACVRRMNYNANGVLNSYRQFEFIYE